MKLRKYFFIVIIIFIFGLNFLPNIVESKIFELKPRMSNTIDKCKECRVPDCVEIGDILFMDMKLYQKSEYMIPGPHNEHSALYIGNNKFIHAGGGC